MTVAIEVQDLKKSYAAVEAVRGIDFTVAAGEIFGFLGPNGAGKTTTIKILCTLLQATSGVARLAGLDVGSSPAEVRRRIGVVFQDPALDDRLTAEENLHLHAVVYRVPRAERAARIDEALRFVDLYDRRKDLTRTFSGGMKRRLEIARGLVHRPDILFLDEPTTGLDPQTRARTWEVLRELRQKFGTTLFLTTHYMDEAENCDRIAIVDHGLIVALDTPAALKQRVGKDLVTARTAAPEALSRLLTEKYGLTSAPADGGLTFLVEAGDAFIVKLLTTDRPPLEGISVRRPTLDDVFLSLTGRQIRAEGAEGNAARLRALVRRRG
ncbi:MAG TPA: ATP-binding cassette domain-containing protein [Polyangia bacterium]|nr:ATP-binding cassette domain-containing protein [Polyangia bacterium]